MSDIPIREAHGARIPAIGLGTWQLSGDPGIECVRTALDLGYRHVDTAAMYENEREVGEGVRASGVARDDVFVTTKVWYTECRADAFRRSAEASLQRLKLDQVDLLLIHWPNLEVDLREQVGELVRAKREGFARHIGVSNFPAQMLRDAVSIADEPIVTNQVEHHPYLSQAAVLDACHETGATLTSYCPIAKAEIFSDAVIRDLCEETGRTPAQVILRWHIQKPGVVAIPRSSKPDRIEENFDIGGFVLDDDQMARIDGLARPDGRMVVPDWGPVWDT